VYRKNDIDNHHTIHSKDEGAGGHGHGSIVAGIAAGNGAPASCTVCGCCRRGGTFVGVAPEADIIAVRVDSEARVFVALTALRQDPDLAGKRVVVNISMGLNIGPHDGTHRLEQAIDLFTASGPTRFVVVAAGNNTGLNMHAFGAVPAAAAGQPGVLDVPIFTAKHDAEVSTLAFYHQVADPLTVQVVSPAGTTSAAFPTSTNGIPQKIAVDSVPIELMGQPLRAPGSEVDLRLTATGPGAALEHDDHWIIRFFNAAAHDVAIDCRVATSLGHPSWRFVAQGETSPAGLRSSDQGTITTPATAKTAIAVANYQNKPDRCRSGSGDIASDSGRGPARGAAAALTKPTIAAPGESITAPKADAANLRGNLCSCCPDWLIELYRDDSGTSMAAPHVTGAIALMLQVNQTMTMAQLQRYLHDSARAAPAPADPNIWGYGKLDVNHAVALALKDALPPPPPTPSPHLATAPAPAVARAAVTPGPLGMRAAAPAFATLIDSLRAATDGERFAALVSRHFSEVRRLINAHPKVATLWHRADGPAMLRQLALHHGGPHGHPALHSLAQRDYFRRFLGQLHRFASPRLATTLERHGDRLVDWLATPA
jgi:subtilisin family serine protease